ncbi:MAG: restriction endonuclease subunit S [Ligilactobacillus agilis]|nr:restriction endonuclease subunit S [Ligilactobacillus agilis]MCI5761004.1 restriction endonuclease subunit S [Ligilactobacillus agilis]
MKYKLGELIDSESKKFDFSKKASVMFVNTGDVFDGKITGVELQVDKLPGQAKKSIRNGDILFSEIRPKNKRFALVDNLDVENYVVSTKLMVLRNKKTDLLNIKYMYYFLTSPVMIEYLQSEAEGRSGTFPQITFKENIANILIDLPALEEQEKIINKLDALDNKLQINKQLNDNFVIA